MDEIAQGLAAGQPVPVAGILFDLDGTLVDSIPAVEAAWRRWAAEYGVTAPISEHHGRTAHTIVASSGIPERLWKEAEHRLGEIESQPQQLDLLPGAAQLLSQIPAERTGIVTSAAARVARARMSAAGLSVPELFVAGTDVAYGKPHPEPYRRARAILETRSGAGIAVAIEDTASGLESARAAGCLAIGVPGTDAIAALSGVAHLVVASLEMLTADVTPTGDLVLTTGSVRRES